MSMYGVHETTDVVIIGGGVTGSSIAYHLRKAGAEVTVLERAEIAAEASGTAAGLLAPMGGMEGTDAFSALLLASWSLYPELIPALEEISGEQAEYYLPGSLHTVSAADDSAYLREQMATWESLGFPVTWLTGDEARQQEPLLGPNVQAAVYGPKDGSIKPAGMTRVYAGAARRLGARYYEHTEVTGIRCSGSRVTGVRTAQGETIACGHLVLAAGPWSARCGEWLNLSIPVSPVRGQILSLAQPETPLKHILFGEDVYLVPKLDGVIYVGATVESVGFDKRVTAGGIAGLLTSAIRLAPALADAPIVRTWAGLRPWSPDSHPILGAAPGWQNVTLATGHSATGFELSAITGKAIAELITTGQTPEIIRPFGIERFAASSE